MLIDEWAAKGIDTVRMSYADIHGVARGKDIPLDRFGSAVEHGVGFCVANLADGLAFSLANLGERLAGSPTDPRFPDMHVRPVVETLVALPWEPTTAWCVGRVDASEPCSAWSPRALVERATAAFAARGLTAVCAPELEFYLLRRDAQGVVSRYTDQYSMIYTVGERADPGGVVREMVRAGRDLRLGVAAVHHECGRGQFEINLDHGEALAAADRAFRFKTMVKELAARRGLLATFMGKPFPDDAGSGLHLHVSLADADGSNRFFDRAAPDGLSGLARHFLAGVLAHAPALMAFGSPTINSYKRIVAGTLVPTSVNWSYDNRTTYARVPSERGAATRVELRAADAAANPYLVIGATLLAGLDGLERKLEPGAASDTVAAGTPLPMTLQESLAALESDLRIVELIGQPMVRAFCDLKRIEVERYRTQVSDWEWREYAWHL